MGHREDRAVELDGVGAASGAGGDEPLEGVGAADYVGVVCHLDGLPGQRHAVQLDGLPGQRHAVQVKRRPARGRIDDGRHVRPLPDGKDVAFSERGAADNEPQAVGGPGVE